MIATDVIVLALFTFFVCVYTQRGREQWTVYYTSPQNFIITFSYSLAQQLWGLAKF